MVIATLEDRKTQTRRVAKNLPEHPAVKAWDVTGHGANATAVSDDVMKQFVTTFPFGYFPCPYGVRGDILYGRETFCKVQTGHSIPNGYTGGLVPMDGCFAYKADGFDKPLCAAKHMSMMTGVDGWEPENNKWTPSIHMPRRASRINLEIVEVRVERLREITEEDAIAEGIQRVGKLKTGEVVWRNYEDESNPFRSPRDSFFSLWASINGRPSLAQNPWVWGVSFKRVEGGAQ
jgi:hypothetical protein